MIDERTILAMLIVVPGLLAAVSLALWHGGRTRVAGLGAWALGLGLSALGSLIAVIAPEEDQQLRPLVSNLGYIPAAAPFGYAVCRFLGSPLRPWRWIAGTALVYVVGAASTLAGWPALWRIGSLSALLVVSASLALVALRHSHEPRGLGRYLLASGLGLMVIGSVFRPIAGLLLDTPITFFAGPSSAVALYLSTIGLGLLLGTLGLIQLCNERVCRDLEDLACHDSLTGLLTRRAFRERTDALLARARRNGEAMALIVLDIDHFKTINDSRGHQQGDVVLREVAALLGRTLREQDLCGRFGGEEFGILLPGAAAEQALATAERLRDAVASGITVCPLTASLGLAAVDAVGAEHSLDTLYRDADEALYRAKASGRNRVVHHALGRA